MRREFNNIVSVIHSFCRLSLLKVVGVNIRFNLVERISPNVVFEINRGCVRLGKYIRIHSESKIKVRDGAILMIGDNVSLNYNNIIICRNKIEIGDGTEFGPGVYVYDHDHDYKNDFHQKFLTSPIKIGKNCWIGAHTVILRETVLGDNCVVGAGSVINGEYSDNSVIIQKRLESQVFK